MPENQFRYPHALRLVHLYGYAVAVVLDRDAVFRDVDGHAQLFHAWIPNFMIVRVDEYLVKNLEKTRNYQHLPLPHFAGFVVDDPCCRRSHLTRSDVSVRAKQDVFDRFDLLVSLFYGRHGYRYKRGAVDYDVSFIDKSFLLYKKIYNMTRPDPADPNAQKCIFFGKRRAGEKNSNYYYILVKVPGTD